MIAVEVWLKHGFTPTLICDRLKDSPAYMRDEWEQDTGRPRYYFDAEGVLRFHGAAAFEECAALAGIAR